MAKDIEQLFEGLVVPEMEYDPKYDVGKVKTKSKSKTKTKTRASVTVDDVPEVVLPKTKAEVYREAKGRLTQKTSAVSKKESGAEKEKRPAVKTVELEIAAVSGARAETESETIKRRKAKLKSPVGSPVWVGDGEDLIPFAWRKPLIADISNKSKLYKQAVRESKALMLPVPHNK